MPKFGNAMLNFVLKQYNYAELTEKPNTTKISYFM